MTWARLRPAVGAAAARACGVETPLVAPLERRVAGDEGAGLEDADFIGENTNVEDAAARRGRGKPLAPQAMVMQRNPLS
jgi:hypothetical protein